MRYTSYSIACKVSKVTGIFRRPVVTRGQRRKAQPRRHGQVSRQASRPGLHITWNGLRNVTKEKQRGRVGWCLTILPVRVVWVWEEEISSLYASYIISTERSFLMINSRAWLSMAWGIDQSKSSELICTIAVLAGWRHVNSGIWRYRWDHWGLYISKFVTIELIRLL